MHDFIQSHLPLLINTSYLIATVLGFGSLIFIHELGHYLMARRCKMRVEEFNIGFGRPLFSKSIDGVMWRLRWLPLGGFVRIAGMEDDPNKPPAPNTYYGSSLAARVQVILAGPLFNVAAGFLLFCAIYVMGGSTIPFQSLNSIVGDLDPSSAFYQAGVRPGDMIVSHKSTPFIGGHFFGKAKASESVKLIIDKFDSTVKSAPRITCNVDLSKDKSAVRKPLISAAAQVLQINGLTATSPLRETLQIGDRLIWADGERLYSVQQLKRLINDHCAFVLYQRGEERHFARIRKIDFTQIAALNSTSLSSSWLSWHEKRLNLKEEELICLPYQITDDNTICSLGESKFDDLKVSPSKLMRGDRILAIDGCPVTSPQEIASLLQTKHLMLMCERPSGFWQKKSAKPMTLKKALNAFAVPLKAQEIPALEKCLEEGPAAINNVHLTKSVALPLNSSNERQLQIVLADAQVRYNPSPFAKLASGLLQPLWAIVGLCRGEIKSNGLAGPIGMAGVIYQSWSIGLSKVFDLLALISLNLAVVNLLPLPVLDGGHLLFALIEALRGKPIKAETMQQLTTFFFLLFAAVGVYIAFNDIIRLLGR